MHHATNTILADRLIQVASQAGHTISRSQLVRWHKAKLLPRPEQRAQGRGRGTVTEYPAYAAGQLRSLLELHAENRRFHAIGLGLWWQGWEVDLTYLRTLLLRVAVEIERTRKAYEAADQISRFDAAVGDQAYDIVEAIIAARLGTSPTRRGQEAAEFVRMMLPTALGVGEPPLADDLRAFESILHQPLSEPALQDAARRVGVFHAAMANTAFRPLIETATQPQLEAARDDLRVMVALRVASRYGRASVDPVSKKASAAKRWRARIEAGLYNPLALVAMLALEQQGAAASVCGPLRELLGDFRPQTLVWE